MLAPSNMCIHITCINKLNALSNSIYRQRSSGTLIHLHTVALASYNSNTYTPYIHAQIAHYHKAFPVDQLLIINYDDLQRDPNTTVNTVLQHIGLPALDVSTITQQDLKNMYVLYVLYVLYVWYVLYELCVLYV